MYRWFLLSAALSVVPLSEAAGQIPDGYEIVHITDNPNDYSSVPKINACGEIVFATRINQSKAFEEIFLYDNGRLSQLTENTVRDAFPEINNDGTAVWTEEADGFGGGTIVMHRDGTVTEIATGTAGVVNNLGNVAWNVFVPEECAFPSAVYLYDGEATIEIVGYGSSNQSVQMNDLNELVWTRFDFCAAPWESDIFRYSQGVVAPLTADAFEPRSPIINNLGQVAWGGPDGIELWEDGRITTLTDWGYNPRINEAGQMYFIRWHEDTSTWQAWLCLDCLVSTEGDPAFLQLTDDPFWNTDGDINDHTEVTWKAKNFPESDIYFLRRIRDADADFDGDVDLDDFATFDACFTGPIPTDRLCECRFLDLDHDRDVDWADFRIFQTNYTGAN